MMQERLSHAWKGSQPVGSHIYQFTVLDMLGCLTRLIVQDAVNECSLKRHDAGKDTHQHAPTLPDEQTSS